MDKQAFKGTYRYTQETHSKVASLFEEIGIAIPYYGEITLDFRNSKLVDIINITRDRVDPYN